VICDDIIGNFSMEHASNEDMKVLDVGGVYEIPSSLSETL
jgi:hypothetical protein